MSILKDWYNGQLYPAEEIVPREEKYRQLQRKIEQERGYFEAQFTPKDRERFDALNCLMLEQSSLYAYANFAYGFKLGLLLLCEVITSTSGPGA